MMQVFSALRIKKGLSSPDGSRSQKGCNEQSSFYFNSKYFEVPLEDSLSQVCIQLMGWLCAIFKSKSLVSVKMYWAP